MPASTEVEKVVLKYNKKKSKLSGSVCSKLIAIAKRHKNVIKGCNDTLVLVQGARDEAEKAKCEAEAVLKEIG